MSQRAAIKNLSEKKCLNEKPKSSVIYGTFFLLKESSFTEQIGFEKMPTPVPK